MGICIGTLYIPEPMILGEEYVRAYENGVKRQKAMMSFFKFPYDKKIVHEDTWARFKESNQYTNFFNLPYKQRDKIWRRFMKTKAYEKAYI